MTVLLSAFVGCVFQVVVEIKNNFLVYNPVSVSFNIKVFTAVSLMKTVTISCRYLVNVTKNTITNTCTISQYYCKYYY